MSKSNKSSNANRAPKILEQVVVEQPAVIVDQVIVDQTTENIVEPVAVVIQQVQNEQTSSSTLDDKGRIRAVPFTLSSDQWADIKKANGLGSTSAQMRYLVGQNYSPSATATFLKKRYQHVRNVMSQILKRPS